MPSKKTNMKSAAAAAPSAPTRRSARIASREPSVASDEEPAVRKWTTEQVIAAHARGEGFLVKHKLTAAALEEVVEAMASQIADLERRNEELLGSQQSLEQELKTQKVQGSMRRARTLMRMHELTEQDQLEQQISAETAKEHPTPATTSSLLVAPRPFVGSPSSSAASVSSPSPAPATPEAPLSTATVVTPSESAAQQQQQPTSSVWRKLLAPWSGYFSSTPAPKRPAEDDDGAAPLSKRARREEPKEPFPVEPSSPSTQKRKRTEEPVAAPSFSVAQRSPHHTPRSAITARDVGVPSSKNPRMPTSLSTITEYTEHTDASILSTFSESTPSRPPRAQSQRPEELPQSTPKMPQSTPKMPQSTPKMPQSTLKMPQSTPTIRRAAVLRAARVAETNAASTGGYAWERSMSKPRERNADIRYQKLERLRQVQKELKELEEDPDVKEVQAHRRKRVKIDDLVSIPHNRPGDSSGTFRVPEADSDDEMEVYESEPERSNVFQDMHMQESIALQQSTPPAAQTISPFPPPPSTSASFRTLQSPATPSAAQTMSPFPPPPSESSLGTPASLSTPKPPQASQPAPTPQAFVTAPSPQPTQTGQASQPSQTPQAQASMHVEAQTQTNFTPLLQPAASASFWNFPSVGPIPDDYYVTEEYKEECGRQFAEGFNNWLAARA